MSELQQHNEMERRLETDLLAKNLRRIDQLSRRGLMLFLDKEISKTNTPKLRAKARLVAIQGSGVEVDMHLARAEQEVGDEAKATIARMRRAAVV